MIPVLLSVVIVIVAGFLGAKSHNNLFNHKISFDFFTAFLAAGICFVGLVVLNMSLLGGNTVVIEKGVYKIVPIDIGEREGYISEIYREGESKGVVIAVQGEDGIITPIFLGSSDSYEILEDGEAKVEADTEIKGNFWFTLGKSEKAKPYKIHIPQNSRIFKYKEK